MTIFGRELTLEQVIGFVECNANPDEDLVHRAALELIAALRESFGAQPANDPLALDELRRMDGEPVWVTHKDGSGGRWGIVNQYDIGLCADINAGTAYWFDDYCGTIAYRRKPTD